LKAVRKRRQERALESRPCLNRFSYPQADDLSCPFFTVERIASPGDQIRPVRGGHLLSPLASSSAFSVDIGSLFVGTIAEWFGVAAAYAAGGGVALAFVLGLGLLWWSGRA
jgi:hypothetical protein